MTNKAYTKQRDLLIPEAGRYANDMYGVKKWGKTNISFRNDWSRTFLLRMNELAVSAGLVEERSV